MNKILNLTARPSRFLKPGRSLLLLMLLVFCTAAFATPTTPTSDFIDNGDGTVTHKLTGLVWMRCSMGQTWDKATANCTGNPATYTWDAALALKSNFAGKSDWRLPNIAELQTIVERENVNPAINTTIFPNTPESWAWSSSTAPRASASRTALVVNFYGGDSYGDSKDYSSNFVRLVRGGQWSFGSLPLTTPTTDFTDNNDGTVTHKRTGLTWQRCAVGQNWTGTTCSGTATTYTWNAAMALKSTFASKSDWRVPNDNELLSIVEHGTYNPYINTAIFPNTPTNSWAWSSSPNARGSSYAWVVSFNYGYDSYDVKGRSYFVRLVRGQWINSSLPSVSNVYGKLHSNSATGAVLANATVSIGTITTKTAANGDFSLNNIAMGQQIVNFAKPGYQSFSTMISVPKKNAYDMGNRWLVQNGSVNPTIAQAPMTGLPGTTFIQWGTGFTPSGIATLHFKKPDGSEYPTLKMSLDSIGHLETPYRTRMNKPAGVYSWWAVDDASKKISNTVTYRIEQVTNLCTAPEYKNALLISNPSCRDKWNYTIFVKEFYFGHLAMQQRLLEATINGTLDLNTKINVAIDTASSIASIAEIGSLKSKNIDQLFKIGSNLSVDLEVKVIDNQYLDIVNGAVWAGINAASGNPAEAIKYAVTTGSSSWNNLLAIVVVSNKTAKFQEVFFAKQFLWDFYRYGSRTDLMAKNYGLPETANTREIAKAVADKNGVSAPWYWIGDYYDMDNVMNIIRNTQSVVSMKQTEYSK